MLGKWGPGCLHCPAHSSSWHAAPQQQRVAKMLLKCDKNGGADAGAAPRLHVQVLASEAVQASLAQRLESERIKIRQQVGLIA